VSVNGLSPSSVRRLLDKLSGSYDVVLVDSGPIPGQTESSVMSACTDGVIMMVSRGDFDADVRKAMQHLELINAQIVGVVFNRAGSRDLERSGYSSSRTSTKSPAPAAENDGDTTDFLKGAEAYARFGPLAQSVLCMSMD
jgi:Mrp family chromosome partitioning ATPase